MAEGVDDSRLVLPFIPSLFHLAIVKVALPLLNEFGVDTLDNAFFDVQNGHLTQSNQADKDHCSDNYNRAKTNLLLIPAFLRRRVWKAVHGLNFELTDWEREHYHTLKFKNEEFSFRWSSIGAIDTVQTVNQIVTDERINTKKRFEIACNYFLVENILELWSKLETPDIASYSEFADDFMVRFWVRWLSDDSRLPWTEAVSEYLDIPLSPYEAPFIRFSAFFPSLRPENRRKFLTYLRWNSYDELRMCLYVMTKEEQAKILEKAAISVFMMYLRWPLLSVFLQTAEKIFNFIGAHHFSVVLDKVLTMNSLGEDFDSTELLLGVWHMTPNKLKENAEIVRQFTKSDIIAQYIQKDRKRNNNEDESKNTKRRKFS